MFATATFLAYGDDRIAYEADGAEVIIGRTPIIDLEDLTLQDQPAVRRSCSGLVTTDTRVVFGDLRPAVLSMQPKHRTWFQSKGISFLHPPTFCIAHWYEG